MLLQRMPSHEAEHDGEALSRDARPETRNHAGGKSSPARFETDPPNARDELAFLYSSCPLYSTRPLATTCCGLFSPKILEPAISPRKRRYPPCNTRAARCLPNRHS